MEAVEWISAVDGGPRGNRFIPEEPGSRYGRWTVVSEAPPNGFGEARWICRCDCGTVKDVAGSSLRHGKSRSCGCSNREATSLSNRTHGMTRTKEYRAYQQAKKRCRRPNSTGYERYGGRGIEFRFESFEEWFDELGPAPRPEFSVDRINNDGHYERGNVRWSTAREQWGNRKCPCSRCNLLADHD